MKRLLLTGSLALSLAGAALASSHTMRDRAETLETLTVAVSQLCAPEAAAISAADCADMEATVATLYTDPAVVTDDDLKRLQHLAAISAKYDTALPVVLSDAVIDLRTLLENTELAALHLLQGHGGHWPDRTG